MRNRQITARFLPRLPTYVNTGVTHSDTSDYIHSSQNTMAQSRILTAALGATDTVHKQDCTRARYTSATQYKTAVTETQLGNRLGVAS